MSPKASYATIKDKLEKKEYDPVYVLEGEEPYYIDDLVSFFETKVIPKESRSFNLTVLHGKEVGLSQIISLAKSYSLYGGKKVLLVKEAQQLLFWKKEPSSLLVNYLNHPNQETILVFCYPYKNLDKRKKITQLLQEKTCFFSSKKIYEDELPKRAQAIMKKKGYMLTEEASILVHTLVGNNLSLLVKELEKITQNLKKGEKITKELLKKHVASSRRYSIFDLQEALLSGDQERLVLLINHLAENPKENPPPQVISFLTTLFFRLLQLKNPLGGEGLPAIHPYVKKNYTKWLPKFPLSRILHALRALHEADKKVKAIDRTSLNDAYILQTLFSELAVS